MSNLGEAQVRAQTTYNAAADAYDATANSFWSRFGLATIQRLELQPGSSVLDVCCGSGASAIPAAQVVGPRGSVLGVDLAERMLEAARRKVRALNSVRAVAPELHKGFNPWDLVCDPTSLRELFARAGIDNVEVVAQAGEHPIDSPEAWWTAVLGSGYRGTYEMLGAEARVRVQSANLAFIRQAGVRSVEANVVFANATKMAT